MLLAKCLWFCSLAWLRGFELDAAFIYSCLVSFWQMSWLQHSIAVHGRYLKVRNWIKLLFWLVWTINHNISQCYSYFFSNVWVAKLQFYGSPWFSCVRMQPLYFMFGMSKTQSIRLYIPLIAMYFWLDFKRCLSTKYRWSINSCLTLNGFVLDYFCLVLS